LNRDPAGYGGGINLYAYADNQSPNGVDPAGFEVWRVTCDRAVGFYYTHSFLRIKSASCGICDVGFRASITMTGAIPAGLVAGCAGGAVAGAVIGGTAGLGFGAIPGAIAGCLIALGTVGTIGTPGYVMEGNQGHKDKDCEFTLVSEGQNPAEFETALCACIIASEVNPPRYSFGGPPGLGYVCGTWSLDMLECAEERLNPDGPRELPWGFMGPWY